MPSKACSNVPPTISLKIFPVTNLLKMATLSNNIVGNTFFVTSVKKVSKKQKVLSREQTIIICTEDKYRQSFFTYTNKSPERLFVFHENHLCF